MYDLSTEKHFVSHTKITLLKNYQRIKSCASEPERTDGKYDKEGLTHEKPDLGHCWDENQKMSKEDKDKDGGKYLVRRRKKEIEEIRKKEGVFFN